jgi:hypothetical protein
VLGWAISFPKRQMFASRKAQLARSFALGGAVFGTVYLGARTLINVWFDTPEPHDSLKHAVRHAVGGALLFPVTYYNRDNDHAHQRFVCAVCEKPARGEKPIPDDWRMAPSDVEAMRKRRQFYASSLRKTLPEFQAFMKGKRSDESK